MKLIPGFAFVAIIIVSIFSCAKRGSITGGPKDETPPQFVRSYPPNFSTNFKSDEVKIYFDELISLDKPDQQVIVSPPMKIKPEITPLAGARKFIKIKFKDTLSPNTTYTINFGSSVVDYNEKNAFPFFQYVFSTGSELDSLSFKGTVVDAFKKDTEKNISAFLYEANAQFNDSTIFTTVPRYVSNTLDSTIFEFKNLKAGTYHLVAVKDKNSNYVYDPKQEKIAFLKKNIRIPEDSMAHIRLFQEALPFKLSRVKQTSKYGFEVGYFGEIDITGLEVTPLVKDQSMEATYFKLAEKDTLKVYIKPFVAQDSMVINIKNNTINDTLISRYKDQYLDTLKVKKVNIKSTLRIEEAIQLTANSPLTEIDPTRINIIDNDSTSVKFTYELNRFKNIASIQFDKKEDDKYTLNLLPEAITDFLGQKNDSIQLNFKTGESAEFGNLALSISGISSPKIVQLTKNDKVIYQKIASAATNNINFDAIDPDEYDVRIIIDENDNGKWDTGNYFDKQQPEKTYFFPETLNIRANWDVQQAIAVPQSLINKP